MILLLFKNVITEKEEQQSSVIFHEFRRLCDVAQ